jgi:hypothetical protein
MGFKITVARAVQNLFRISGLPALVQASSNSLKKDIKSCVDVAVASQQDYLVEVSNRNAQVAAGYVDKGTQILLGMKYREAAEKGVSMSFADTEFRNHSQTGEDGILWYLFSLIGSTNKQVVEMCAGVGYECNSANLIINHGWHGVLFDGNAEHIEAGRNFFAKHPDTKIVPPHMIKAWITAENVNELIEASGAVGEIDLFSLDLDGVDYWVLKALNVISPRIIVVEFEAAWEGDKSVTVPYAPDFMGHWMEVNREKNSYAQYGGASLQAFVGLARDKGYRLVGTNSLTYNAFFVRNDIASDFLPEIDATQVFTHPVCYFAYAEGRKAFERSVDFPWEEV